MIDDKEFLVFINDKTLDGSLEQNLSRIIDEELEKPEEEMDTELIEYCLDRLNKLQATEINSEEIKDIDKSNIKQTKVKYKRIVVVAAVLAVIFIGAFSASATIFNVNLFGGVVELYNDYIRINFDKIDNDDGYEFLGTELRNQLIDNGFDAVRLPEAFFLDEYKITNIEYETGEFINSANIKFKIENAIGGINISKYSMEEIVPDVEFLNVTGNIEELTIGNIKIYCFMQKDAAAITYRDGLSIYYIQIPINLVEAIAFAKTIN